MAWHLGTPPTNKVVVHLRLTVEESMGAIIIAPPQTLPLTVHHHWSPLLPIPSLALFP